MVSEKSPNLILKYAIFGLVGGLGGVFVSQYLGYNDGSMQTYLIGAIACGVGAAVGDMIRQRKGQTS